jgi:hypothetical protein
VRYLPDDLGSSDAVRIGTIAARETTANASEREQTIACRCVMEPHWLSLASDGWEWSGRWESKLSLRMYQVF